jgi:hypothetical protein
MGQLEGLAASVAAGAYLPLYSSLLGIARRTGMQSPPSLIARGGESDAAERFHRLSQGNSRFIPAFSLSFLGDPGREMHRFWIGFE